MPRRGLFQAANQFGVFDQATGDNIPPPPPGESEPAPAPAPNPPNLDNLGEILETVMPGAFPQFQEDMARPAPAANPGPQAPLQTVFPPQLPPLVKKQGLFRRLANHMSNRDMVPLDFQAPPTPLMSWTEVRARLGPPPQPPNPAQALYEWDAIRYRIGLRPTFEYVGVQQQQQQQAMLQNQAQMAANMAGQFPPGLQPQIQPVAGAQQPAGAPQYMLIQTPQGPMYIPQPPAPGTHNPLTGRPAENPWSQQDAKGLATTLLLAGVKLTWNAASAMWDAATAAYNQNFEDKMKMRDETNQWINECVRRGSIIPAQRNQLQYPQAGGWPQWGPGYPMQTMPQGPIPQQPLPQRWP
ncbi:hypothetical protein TWF481_009132 [Arthrobotrys musiformis]|uniref:Uncharacterized protein n=1 Tax=Arthrobotrys musiformis TaxID=47236 RepID=A0AAV9W2U9_9PEZI